MKRKWKLGVLLGFIILYVGNGYAADNRPWGKADVATMFKPMWEGYHIKFSTIVAANTATMLVGSMTATSFNVGPFVNYSTGTASGGSAGLVNSSTNTLITYGGRAYLILQYVSGASNMFLDYTANDISTSSSNFITSGQYWSSDDPVAYQGPIYAMSTSTGMIVGHIFMEKSR